MRPDFRNFKGNGVAMLFGSFLQHSAKGSTWEDHKYLETKGKGKKKKYYYDDSYEGGRHLEKGGKKNIRGWYDPNTGAPVNAAGQESKDSVSRSRGDAAGQESKDSEVRQKPREEVVSKNPAVNQQAVTAKATKTPEQLEKDRKNALKSGVKNRIEEYLSKAVDGSSRTTIMNTLKTMNRDAESLKSLYKVLNPNGNDIGEISDKDATYIINSLNHEYNVAPKLSEVKDRFKDKFKYALSQAKSDAEKEQITSIFDKMEYYNASNLKNLWQFLDPGGNHSNDDGLLNEISDSEARSVLSFLNNLYNKKVEPKAQYAVGDPKMNGAAAVSEAVSRNAAVREKEGAVSKQAAVREKEGAVSKNPAVKEKEAVSKQAAVAGAVSKNPAVREPDDIKTKTLSKEEINDLANRGIRGEFGNGQARKDALGKNYQVVQNRINEILLGSGSSQKVSSATVSSSTAKKVSNAVNSVANQKVSTSSKTTAKSYTNQELKDMADKEAQRVMQKVAEMAKKKKK